MGVAELIAEQYPFLAFLANHPEVGPLLQKAVDINSPYSPEKFTSELMKTNWWTKQSDAQREWQITQNVRPGEAAQRRNSYKLGVHMAANAFGAQLTPQQIAFFTEIGLSQGLDPNGPEMMEALRRARKGAPSKGYGKVGVSAHEIRASAEGQWFVRPNMNDVTRMAENVALGRDSLESINARYSLQARKRYPHLAEELMSGMTLAEIVAPLRDTVAQELERTPADININGHPVWRQLVTGIRDPTTKKVRQMTESEAIRLARQQDPWWKTANGRQMDNNMATSLANIFGKRKSTGVSV